jgi:hypothetical protein
MSLEDKVYCNNTSDLVILLAIGPILTRRHAPEQSVMLNTILPAYGFFYGNQSN